MPHPRQRPATADTGGSRARRIACKSCRQAKMRCELSAGGTIPCARCQRMNRECRIDMEYKRMNKQEKLDELENELRQLRSSISAAPVVGPQVLESFANENRASNEESSDVRSGRVPQFGTQMCSAFPAVAFDATSDAPKLDKNTASSRSFDGTSLDPDSILGLFNIFFDEYHRHLPFLDPSSSPDEYYGKSPLIFWTIVYVASRRYSGAPELILSLIPFVKKLLWDSISSPPHTLELVQSIILLCTWPFPTSSLTTDNTITLAMLAHSISLQLGLHRPDVISDFSRTRKRLNLSELSDSVKTWVACYITYQSLSIIDGHPSPFSDWTIDRLCAQRTYAHVPDSLLHQLKIYRFEARACSSISEVPKNVEGLPRPGDTLPLLALLEQEFNDLWTSIGDQLTDENAVQLDGAGLHIYIFYLLESGGPDVRRRALLRAYSLATGLIRKVSDLAARSNWTHSAPQVNYYSLSLSAMLILKLSYSNYSKFIDLEEGKRMYHTATNLMRQTSLEDNDLQGRMSKILKQLWSSYAHVGQINEEPSLKLKTRLAASLLHDLLWTWRDAFGSQSNGLGSGSGTSNTTFGTASPGTTGSQTYASAQVGEPSIQTLEGCNFDLDALDLEDILDEELLSQFPFTFDANTTMTT